MENMAMHYPSALVQRAYVFAKRAHGEQRRKYTGLPYMVHPVTVCSLVKRHYHAVTDAMLAAALLHDVVEDTPCSFADIGEVFGGEVAELVFWLTDVSRPEDGNRRIRKAKDCQHLRRAPADAQIIKVADIADNTKSIIQHDAGFAPLYVKEKCAQLDVMGFHAQSWPFYQQVRTQLINYLESVSTAA